MNKICNTKNYVLAVAGSAVGAGAFCADCGAFVSPFTNPLFELGKFPPLFG